MTKFLFRNYISKNVCFLIVQYVSSSGCLPPGDVLSQSLYVLPSPPMCLKVKKKYMVMLVGIKLKLKYERNICNKINEVRKCLANIFLFFIFLLLLFFLFHNNFCFGPKHFTPTNTVMFFKNDNTAHPYQIKNTNANQNNQILTLA